MRLVDMHCHLDLMANGPDVAGEAAARGLGLFDVTVTPAVYGKARDAYAGMSNVRVGAGLHPWWLADGTCDERDIDELVAHLAGTPYVGEIGLDFSARHRASAPLQTAALTAVARTCAEHPLDGRILSIHAVQSASAVLDILERHDLVSSATCILHWFSGTSDELTRARRAGCLFSINGRMLATKRGREYARIMPERALLLETDAPPGDRIPYSAQLLEQELAQTLEELAAIRGVDARELGETIAERSTRLLGMR